MTSGATLFLSGAWTNAGGISLTDSTLRLGGTYTTAQLAAEGVLDNRVTAIHATHTSTHEVALLARARPKLSKWPACTVCMGRAMSRSAEVRESSSSFSVKKRCDWVISAGAAAST